MESSEFATFVEYNMAVLEEVWATGDLEAWLTQWTSDLKNNNYRHLSAGSFQGAENLIERTWPLQQFFPTLRQEIIGLWAPWVDLRRLFLSDGSGNDLEILSAFGYTTGGLIFEWSAWDADVPHDVCLAESERIAELAATR